MTLQYIFLITDSFTIKREEKRKNTEYIYLMSIAYIENICINNLPNRRKKGLHWQTTLEGSLAI